jgi:hypothetical protein
MKALALTTRAATPAQNTGTSIFRRMGSAKKMT